MPRSYSIFLFVTIFCGLVVVIIATIPFGVGVSADAVRILSTADNLLKGRGFFDYSGLPLLWWPPLYPVLLASLSKLTGIDLFVIAWALNIVSYGFVIWLAGKLFFHIFQDRVIWAYLGIVITTISLSIFKVTVSVGPDIAFIAMALAFLVTLGSWNRKSLKVLILLGILAALSTMHRLLAIVLPATGALYILIKSNLKRKFLTAGIFSVFSCLPLITWLIVHNYLQYDTVFGPRNYGGMSPWKNSISFAEKILNWFVPYFLSINNFPNIKFGLIVIILFVGFATYNKANWGSLKNKFLAPEMLPSLLFLSLYLIVSIFTINYSEHHYSSDDRFLAVIFIPVVGLLFLLINKLIIPEIPSKKAQINLILTLGFGAWCIYPGCLLYDNISNSYEIQGVVHNNIFNTPQYRDSETIQAVENLIEERNVPIALYSNNPAAIWLFTRHEVKLLPVKPIIDQQAILSELADTTNASEVYIVWLIPDVYDLTITPQGVAKFMPIRNIFTNPDGEIYIIDK